MPSIGVDPSRDGSSAMPMPSRARLTTWAPASARRLPIRREARAAVRSVKPHTTEANRPSSRPVGIGGVYGAGGVGPGAVPCYTSRPVGRLAADLPVGM